MRWPVASPEEDAPGGSRSWELACKRKTRRGNTSPEEDATRERVARSRPCDEAKKTRDRGWVLGARLQNP
ncbi:unnamed protein product [Linum trigynum]|uniref:Uncharacterized protein n=1 Tax=Linum trigynum TaxID=586398 RepID=A0AAV2FZT5_9ROSI